jgi:hypothetical protein
MLLQLPLDCQILVGHALAHVHTCPLDAIRDAAALGLTCTDLAHVMHVVLKLVFPNDPSSQLDELTQDLQTARNVARTIQTCLLENTMPGLRKACKLIGRLVPHANKAQLVQYLKEALHENLEDIAACETEKRKETVTRACLPVCIKAALAPVKTMHPGIVDRPDLEHDFMLARQDVQRFTRADKTMNASDVITAVVKKHGGLKALLAKKQDLYWADWRRRVQSGNTSLAAYNEIVRIREKKCHRSRAPRRDKLVNATLDAMANWAPDVPPEVAKKACFKAFRKRAKVYALYVDDVSDVHVEDVAQCLANESLDIIRLEACLADLGSALQDRGKHPHGMYGSTDVEPFVTVANDVHFLLFETPFLEFAIRCKRPERRVWTESGCEHARRMDQERFDAHLEAFVLALQALVKNAGSAQAALVTPGITDSLKALIRSKPPYLEPAEIAKADLDHKMDPKNTPATWGLTGHMYILEVFPRCPLCDR